MRSKCILFKLRFCSALCFLGYYETIKKAITLVSIVIRTLNKKNMLKMPKKLYDSPLNKV